MSKVHILQQFPRSHTFRYVDKCLAQVSVAFSYHIFFSSLLFPRTDTETFNKAVFCFSHTHTFDHFLLHTDTEMFNGRHCSFPYHILFIILFSHIHTEKFQQMQCLFCTSVSLYVCVESSNFLSHFLKYSISLLQFCFSSQFFFYSTHTHTFISSLSSQLHTLTHTHKFHHQDM